MREEYKRANWRDFGQRYEGTFGWYEKEDGKTILVQLQSVSDSKLLFTDAEGFTYTAIPDTGNAFQFIPVERGVHNIPNDVVFCERMPARQWRRGMHHSNTKFISMTGTGLYGGPSFELIEKVFNPPLASIKSRLDVFKEKLTGAAALNNTFSIINNGAYCYQHRIGEYKNQVVHLNNNLFEQEMNDLMRDLNMPIKVEVK